jgi:hypothetical protein
MAGELCTMTTHPEENKAVLKIHVDFISLDKVFEFRAACLHLLETGFGQLVVDLSYLKRIPSGVLAAVMDIGLLASANVNDPQQVVVLAGPAVARQFRCFEHSSLLDIRQWDSESAGSGDVKLAGA